MIYWKLTHSIQSSDPFFFAGIFLLHTIVSQNSEQEAEIFLDEKKTTRPIWKY